MSRIKAYTACGGPAELGKPPPQAAPRDHSALHSIASFRLVQGGAPGEDPTWGPTGPPPEIHVGALLGWLNTNNGPGIVARNARGGFTFKYVAQALVWRLALSCRPRSPRERARDLPLHRHFRRHRPFSVKVGASTAKRLRVTSSWSTAGSVATLDDDGSRNNPAGAGFGSGKGFSSVARSPKALTVTASIMKATRRLQGEGVPLSRHHAQPNL